MKNNLSEYLLHLADDALILSHRLSEWCGHGPILEQDIAVTNIALDLIGQARNFYQYAATIIGEGATEDSLAYLRDSREFKNCLLVEQPNDDWAVTVLRQFFFSNFQHLLYKKLQNSTDLQIAAIAEKALKEISYHLKWSSEWVIRLGDGTKESNERINDAINKLWSYTGEIFIAAGYETQAANEGYGAKVEELKNAWLQKTEEVFKEATLVMPAENVWMQKGGKNGIHSEHLGFILADMQFMQRAYPGSEW